MIHVESTFLGSIILKIITKTAENYSGNSNIKRKYGILEFQYSDFDTLTKEIIGSEANILIENANDGAANSGLSRNLETKSDDAFSGIIAEFAVLQFLNTLVPNSANRPIVTTSHNQVDITWQFNEKNYSIEVRSSFVKNGIDFALFATNEKTNMPYFDMLGPYYQTKYKTDYESDKDSYFRVLYPGIKKNIYSKLVKNNESFYIIGELSNKELKQKGYHKKLSPEEAVSSNGNLTGDYFVSPINSVVDCEQFILNNNLSL